MTIRTIVVFLCFLSLVIVVTGCQSTRSRKPVGVMSSAPLTKAQRDAMNQWSGQTSAKPAAPAPTRGKRAGGYEPVPETARPEAAPPPEPTRGKRGKRVETAQAEPAPAAAPAAETPAERSKNTPGYTTLVINNRDSESNPPSRSKRSDRRKAEAAQTAQAVPTPAPAPGPTRGKRSVKRAPEVQIQPAALVQPAPSAGPLTEQDMAQAYQQFDVRYQASLGKTRKELKDLWGFPMTRLGENGVEVAYGFRQRGVLDPVESAKGKGKVKKTSYYASGEMGAGSKGQSFACLVVLWVDKNGRGVVVDGEAVGDCFHAESLPKLPAKFER